MVTYLSNDILGVIESMVVTIDDYNNLLAIVAKQKSQIDVLRNEYIRLKASSLYAIKTDPFFDCSDGSYSISDLKIVFDTTERDVLMVECEKCAKASLDRLLEGR